VGGQGQAHALPELLKTVATNKTNRELKLQCILLENFITWMMRYNGVCMKAGCYMSVFFINLKNIKSMETIEFWQAS
jgi:hypothetical protein